MAMHRDWLEAGDTPDSCARGNCRSCSHKEDAHGLGSKHFCTFPDLEVWQDEDSE